MGSFSSAPSRLVMARGISSTAMRLAFSPACCPPMPSATMKRFEVSRVIAGISPLPSDWSGRTGRRPGT